MTHRDAFLAHYLAYLTACNERRWLDLRAFVADEVVANGVTRNRQQYIDDIRAVTDVFQDYRWSFVRAVWEAPWLAVHLTATGTRPDDGAGHPEIGIVVQTDEFVMYRFSDDRIVHMEGTADNARLHR